MILPFKGTYTHSQEFNDSFLSNVCAVLGGKMHKLLLGFAYHCSGSFSPYRCRQYGAQPTYLLFHKTRIYSRLFPVPRNNFRQISTRFSFFYRTLSCALHYLQTTFLFLGHTSRFPFLELRGALFDTVSFFHLRPPYFFCNILSSKPFYRTCNYFNITAGSLQLL